MNPKDYFPWPSPILHIKEILPFLESAEGRASLQFELTLAIKIYLRANRWMRAVLGGFHFPGVHPDDPSAQEILRVYNILLDDQSYNIGPFTQRRNINIYYRAYRSARKQIRDEERRSRQ